MGGKEKGGRQTFHSILSYWIQMDKPAGKRLPSDPAWFPAPSCPRCRWCRTSGTRGRAAGRPTACPLSPSRGGCSPSPAGSLRCSGLPRSRRTSSPSKMNKIYTARLQNHPKWASQGSGELPAHPPAANWARKWNLLVVFAQAASVPHFYSQLYQIKVALF